MSVYPLLQGKCSKAFSTYCWVLCHCQQYTHIKCCTPMLLWQIYVTDNNTAYSYCNVQCPTFLYEYKQIWIFVTDFHKRPPYQILQTSVQWEQSCNVWTGQTWQSWKVHIVTMWTCLQAYEWVILSNRFPFSYIYIYIYIYIKHVCSTINKFLNLIITATTYRWSKLTMRRSTIHELLMSMGPDW